MSATPASVHGVPLLPTASADSDTVWVVGGGAPTIFRSGPISVEVGLSEDDWTENQSHLRAEERLVCAVQRPTQVSKITVT